MVILLVLDLVNAIIKYKFNKLKGINIYIILRLWWLTNSL